MKKMVHTAVITVTVSMAFSCLFLSGCKKRVKPQDASRAVAPVPAVLEKVFTNRVNNAAYIDSLKQNFKTQLEIAKERREVAAQMDACKERVTATLPAGSDKAVVEQALAKDETWKKLKAQDEKAQKEDQQTLEEAQKKVRQAMIEQARAQKAVAEGKAKAIDQAQTK